jgi:hypothetical protein
MNGTKIPHVDGLEEWELGLLFEIRLLHEAGALAPVLEAMTVAMAALSAEAERQEERQRAKQLKEQIRQQRRRGELAQALRSATQAESPLGGHPSGDRDLARMWKTVAERTNAGRLLARHESRFTTEDAIWAMCQQIARATRINAANRVRSYVFGSA